MKADDALGIYVADGTVTAAHIRGRDRNGDPVDLFGRQWKIIKTRELEGHLLAVLEPIGAPSIMCKRCGGFDYDQPGGPGDPLECQGCPNRGYPEGLLF